MVVPRCKLSFIDRDVPRGVASAVAGGRIGMGFLRSRACYWYVRFLVWGGGFFRFFCVQSELETWERDDNDYDQCDEGG